MKVEKVSVAYEYACDSCAKVASHVPNDNEPDTPKGWYEFEHLSDVGVRLFEKPQQLRNREIKNLTGRRVVAFCSAECAWKFIQESMQNYLAELRPVIGAKQQGFSIIS